MNRLKTDFLSASSSFAAGFGSVINIQGQNFEYNSSNDPDQIALSLDWQIVGQDIRDALEGVQSEIHPMTGNE